MKVRELQHLLLGQDPEAEVLVSSDLMLAREQPRPGTLTLPTRDIEAGHFCGGDLDGQPWVSVVATDAWGVAPVYRKGA